MKKQLLKESEVRKLMKFANIGGLTDGFVSKLTEADMMDPEEEEGGDLPAPGPEVDADPEMSLDPEVPEAPEDEIGDPEMEGEEPGGELADKVEDLVAKLDDVLTAANPELAGMVSSQRGEDDAPVDDAPVGDVPVEEPAGEEELDMAAPPEEEEGEADLEEDMINEVARRVARRLKKLRRR